jgi:ribosomal protein S6
MDYYTRLINQTGDICRPLLSATDADLEIERLNSIIKAQAGTIHELQEVIRKAVRK